MAAFCAAAKWSLFSWLHNSRRTAIRWEYCPNISSGWSTARVISQRGIYEMASSNSQIIRLETVRYEKSARHAAEFHFC